MVKLGHTLYIYIYGFIVKLKTHYNIQEKKCNYFNSISTRFNHTSVVHIMIYEGYVYRRLVIVVGRKIW